MEWVDIGGANIGTGPAFNEPFWRKTWDLAYHALKGGAHVEVAPIDTWTTINGMLVKLGYAKPFGGKYTWQWLYDDDQYRWRGLSLIGFDLALAISRGILNLEGDSTNG